MNLFYADPREIHEHSLVIRGQEAVHITKVLRHSAGDQLAVTDGQGSCFTCRIQEARKEMVVLDVLKVEKMPEKEPLVTLCLGIIKKRDRLEFAIEKAVELGASKIVLFKAEHSQKEKVREDRLASTAVSAMKQSLRFYLPQVFVEESLQSALSVHANNARIVVADETKKEEALTAKIARHYFLIVGPEGGFSARERQYLNTIKPEYYSLGDKRLRTETACIVMVDRFVNL